MKKVLLIITIIILINIFLVRNIGNKYLKSLNIFIKENNNIIVNRSINNIIKNDLIYDISDLYNIIMNQNDEIVSLNLNTNQINKYLKLYVTKLSKTYDENSYAKYIKKYYEIIKTNKNTYILMPMGIMYNNPFLYNVGPKIIMSYNYINSYNLKVKVDIKNYGLNNALVETYLIVNFEQKVIKPILKKASSYEYKFLLNSRIINGRIPTFIGDNITTESQSVNID